MAPKHVRFVALTSIGAIVAVAINAFLLNGKPRDAKGGTAAAPKQAAAPRSPVTVHKRGALEPTATERDVALPQVAAAEGDPVIIRALKRALNERGYGPLTGETTTGLLTRAAILAFEFDHGLALHGEATELLLTRMAAHIQPSTTVRQNLKVATPAAEAVVRHVQHKLHVLGYLEGRIDGRLGEATQTAIRRFEVDQNLPPRGRVSVEVVERLQTMGGRS